MEREGKLYVAIAQCKCGVRKRVRKDNIDSGKVKSCGCLRKERFLRFVKQQARNAARK